MNKLNAVHVVYPIYRLIYGIIFGGFLRPGSSDRGRPADVNPPEADLVGVEAVEPQVAEDEGSDRTRSHALLTLP